MKEANAHRLELETDYFRKYNNRFVSRERRFRSVQLRSFHLFLILVLIAVLFFCAQRATAFVLTWDRLSIRTVRVTGAPAQERSEMWSIINQFRGNILAVNLEVLKQRLLALRQVKEVSISRDLPSTLDVCFELRRPLVRWHTPTGWRVFDETGVFLYATEDSADAQIPVIQTEIDKAEKIFARASELKKLAGVIDHVAYRLPYGLEVKLKGIGEVFYPGEGDMHGKFREYFRVKSQLLAGEHPIYVDMRLPDRFYLGYNEKNEEMDEK